MQIYAIIVREGGRGKVEVEVVHQIFIKITQFFLEFKGVHILYILSARQEARANLLNSKLEDFLIL